MRSIIIFLAVFVVINAAGVQKLNEVEGSVKFLEIDSNGVSYAVTTTYDVDHFYVIGSNNSVTYISSFKNVVNLMLTSQEDIYVFDFQNQNGSIQILTLNSSRLEMVERLEFIPMSDPTDRWSLFFDDDDNLFFNSIEGISILRKNENDPVVISNTAYYHIINNLTNAVDVNGNVFIGINIYDNRNTDVAVILTKDEIRKPNPTAYFINMDMNYLSDMAAFNDGIFLGTSQQLIYFKDDSEYKLVDGDFTFPNSLTVTKDRLYYKYESGHCRFEFLTPDFQYQEVEIKALTNCNFYQTIDGNGDAFIGDSRGNSVVYLVKNSETSSVKMNIPNTLFIYGLAATENGNLWFLAQNLYLIPWGSTDAAKVTGLPYVDKPWPMKAKPNTDEVLIGMDDGIYVATV